jgi:S1-C subfamily serine protease
VRSFRLVWTAALCAALVALVAGCGGDSNDSSTAALTTPTDAATTASSAEEAVVQSSKGFSPEAIYKKVSPGVVTILSIFNTNGGSALGGAQGGQGSGFVISKDGEIVTNAHVVTSGGQGAEAGGGPITKAKEVFVELADHNRLPADIVGIDPDADVALIRINPSGLDLTPVALSDGKGIAVGQPVAAIGSPFGEEQSLSIGIVSATDRTIPSLTNFSIDGALQTDAAINPGNSGGPLLDGDARVIGINQQIQTETGSHDGVGFAVPVSAVKRSIAQLEDDGKVEYAYIGVSTQALYPQLADELDLGVDYGGLIAEVVPGGPADKAGLRGGDGKTHFQGFPVTTGGDVILSVDGHKVLRPEDLARDISSFQPGDEVTLEILHDGDREAVKVTLGERPDGGSQG